jgi:hypothetical protein
MELISFWGWFWLLQFFVIFMVISLLSLRVVVQLVNRALLFTIEID